MVCVKVIAEDQLSRGVKIAWLPGPLLVKGKFWINAWSLRVAFPVAAIVGSATARVWITSPRCDSKSACAFWIVLFCFRVRFSASTSDKGCVIHPGILFETEAELVCAHPGMVAADI